MNKHVYCGLLAKVQAIFHGRGEESKKADYREEKFY